MGFFIINIWLIITKFVLMKSGVYIITCLVNGKHYIGYSGNILKRLNVHKSHLRNNKHPNCYLQNAVNIYGITNFSFEIIEHYPVEIMASMENWWCNMLNTHDRNYGYNIEPTNPEHKKNHSGETKIKIGNANRGKVKSIECRLKISKYSKNRVQTSDEIEKRRLHHVGAKRSKEAKKNMSDAQKKSTYKRGGYKLSEEARSNMSKSKTGKPSPNKGKKMSEEFCINNKIAQMRYLYLVQTPNGNLVEVDNVVDFSNKHKLSYPSLMRTLKGFDNKGNKYLQHKGYKIVSRDYIKIKQTA